MEKVSRAKMIVGTTILVIGFTSPLLIPVVTNSNLSTAWKTGLSGALALGIPEVFMIVAIAIMGKSGYQFIKSKLARFLHPILPPDQVSLTRYRIGLVLFFAPLVIGWILPYVTSHFPILNNLPVWYYVIGDSIFILSLFILGGDFWDKLKDLFSHKVSGN